MKLKNSLHALFSIFGLLLVSPVNAAWYQVEVIVFDQLFPDFDGERWYENPGLPDRDNSIELITELADGDEESIDIKVAEQQSSEILPYKPESIPYLQLDLNKLRLEGVQRVLKLSREYRPLMHVAWQQPGFTSNRAREAQCRRTTPMLQERSVRGAPPVRAAVEILLEKAGTCPLSSAQTR